MPKLTKKLIQLKTRLMAVAIRPSDETSPPIRDGCGQVEDRRNGLKQHHAQRGDDQGAGNPAGGAEGLADRQTFVDGNSRQDQSDAQDDPRGESANNQRDGEDLRQEIGGEQGAAVRADDAAGERHHENDIDGPDDQQRDQTDQQAAQDIGAEGPFAAEHKKPVGFLVAQHPAMPSDGDRREGDEDNDENRQEKDQEEQH